jgi:hypothetical protein
MKHHLVDALDESNEQIMVNIIVYLEEFQEESLFCVTAMI